MPEPQGLVYRPHEAAVRIEALNMEKVSLGSATGTIVLRRVAQTAGEDGSVPEHRAMLVTNWHVVTGIDPHTKRWNNENNQPEPPAFLRLHVQDGGTGEPCEVDIRLYAEDEEIGRWHEHPLGRIIDVAAIDVTDETSWATRRPVDLGDLISNERLRPFLDVTVETGDEVVVSGYPFGQRSGPHAILMQAMLSSDLDRGITVKDNMGTDHLIPGALIDLPAASKGCSGSLVYVFERQWTVTSGARISWSKRTAIPIGLYSGRIHGKGVIGRIVRIHDVAEAVTGPRTELRWMHAPQDLEVRDRMPRRFPALERAARIDGSP